VEAIILAVVSIVLGFFIGLFIGWFSSVQIKRLLWLLGFTSIVIIALILAQVLVINWALLGSLYSSIKAFFTNLFTGAGAGVEQIWEIMSYRIITGALGFILGLVYGLKLGFKYGI